MSQDKKKKKKYEKPKMNSETIVRGSLLAGAVCDGIPGGPDAKKVGSMGVMDGCTTKLS